MEKIENLIQMGRDNNNVLPIKHIDDSSLSDEELTKLFNLLKTENIEVEEDYEMVLSEDAVSSNDTLKKFYEDMLKYPVLDSKEQILMAKKAKLGDNVAKDKLLLGNLRLVFSVAKRYYNNGILSMEDLVQEGSLGLMKAYEKFDPELGYKFSTYAYIWIRQAIIRASDNKSRLIRLPVAISQRKFSINRFEREYYNINGKNPSISEISDQLGCPYKDVENAKNGDYSYISLYYPATHKCLDGDYVIADFLQADSDVQREIDDKAEKEELLKVLKKHLTEKEFKVIFYRYYVGCTLREIGNYFNDLSRQRVNQIEQRALEKVKPYIEELMFEFQTGKSKVEQRRVRKKNN